MAFLSFLKNSRPVRIHLIIFSVFFLVRLLFVLISGFDNYELQGDVHRYLVLSEKVLKGDFNFDIGIFIVAPFYPVYIAIHKLLFGSFWDIALSISQMTLASLSGVYLYKSARLLFNDDNRKALLATGIYCVFPMTLIYVHTFAQEILFQSFLIIFIYYLIQSVKKGSYKYLIISAIIFSITFLVKSHILLYAPFVVIFFFLNFKNQFRKSILFSGLFGLIALTSTLPFGLYNLKHHKVYTLSSNGVELFFYAGNTEYSYQWIVNTPERGTKEFAILLGMDTGFSYYNGPSFDSITRLPQHIKHKLYLKEAVEWVKNNQEKFWEMKWQNFVRFFMPGISFKHYPFLEALIIFIVSFPVYLLAYIGIAIALKRNFSLHFWVLGMMVTMLIFSVIFYLQSRFRIITMEPFYTLYSGYAFSEIIDYFKSRRSK